VGGFVNCGTKLKSLALGRGAAITLLGASAVAGGTLLVACGAAEGDGDEPTLAMAQGPLQLAWVGTSESSTTDGVNLIKASSQTRKGKSTGAIRIVNGAINASCGATFISNRRAVTAAHCVDKYTTSQTFTVEQYNTTNLNITSAINQAKVSGTWPGYARPVKVSAADGYIVIPYTCKVERRCAYSPLNCPTGASTADIAMIYCSGRSTAAQTVKNWVPVATTDTIGSTVDVWWFHELLDLSISDVAYTMPYAPNFNWEHYGHYEGPGTEGSNFHYTQTSSERQQLFPLRSTHSKQNVLYRSSGTPSSSTNTNVPVCHGTSGSGVFRGTADELLGVVNTGTSQVGTDYNVLCSDMDAVIGTSSMQYSSRPYTAIFGGLTEVTTERN